MAITVTAPDAFYECEPWVFTLTLRAEPSAPHPMDLTGSRLFVRFADPRGTSIATCDSASLDGSLVISNPTQGVCQFHVPSVGRTWRIHRAGGPYAPPSRAIKVSGDLYRYASPGAEPAGIATITFDVLPSTGLPA